jgi:YesN/AraC family two-component response regulator
MRRYVLYEPFNIYHFEADHWQHPVHNHTYFEIIFILKGKGQHTVNGNRFAYRAGDIFLLGPEDYHSFDISVTTEFCYIRFMESFSKYSGDKDKAWQQTVKTLLHTPYQTKGSIVKDKSEIRRLHQLLGVLEAEYNHRHDPMFEAMRDSLMKAIMTILARNVVKNARPGKANGSTSSIEDVLLYVRQNIYQPEKLRIDHLSEKFHHAPGYLSIRFKKHSGESLKQYIVKYKLKLIETRLLYSALSLTEIADEFGFTDESYMSKQFKKYTGVSPGDFRNQKKRQKNS